MYQSEERNGKMVSITGQESCTDSGILERELLKFVEIHHGRREIILGNRMVEISPPRGLTESHVSALVAEGFVERFELEGPNPNIIGYELTANGRTEVQRLTGTYHPRPEVYL